MPIGTWLLARERSRQPKPWEHGVLKAGHGADPVAGEGENVQADPVADAGRGAQVGPERWLTVGSRWHEVEPAARAEEAGAEAGHDVAALVLEWHRWHRDEDVVGQQGYQRVDILAATGAAGLVNLAMLVIAASLFFGTAIPVPTPWTASILDWG